MTLSHQDTLDAEDFLQGIVEALYVTGDTQKLEGCVEELCWIMHVTCPNKPIRVAVKRTPTMHWFLGYQRAILDNNKRSIEDYKNYMEKTNE